MKLLIDRLGERPVEHRFEPDPGWWREACALMPELSGEAPEGFRFRFAAHRMGSDVYLEGMLEGSVQLTCGRCLKRYGHALAERFRLVLEPAGERVPADPEGAVALARDGVWLGDELESGWFRGHVIELGPYFREVVALALPVQPVCRDDCLGLCPSCGGDRNVERCDCAGARTRSPFAVLGALKGDPSKGRG